MSAERLVDLAFASGPTGSADPADRPAKIIPLRLFGERVTPAQPTLLDSNEAWFDPERMGGTHRFFVRPDLADLFGTLGWRSVLHVMNSLLPEVRRTVGERDNCRIAFPPHPTELGVRTGLVGFLKRHRERSFRRGSVSPGLAEARAAMNCRRAGVPAMEPLAAGESIDANGVRCSFFLSGEIVGGVQADHWFDAAIQRGASADELTQALDAIADTAGRFHRARLFHRDFYLCHFFLTPEPAGSDTPLSLTARLIDLQRVPERPRLPIRHQLKDLGQLLVSLPPPLRSRNSIDRFFRGYFEGEEGRPIARLIRRLALARAWFYRLKDGHR
jgi:hypothetical protein